MSNNRIKRKRHNLARSCANPHCTNPPATRRRHGYCLPCYWYHRRNHTNRPTHLIERHYHRTINRILAHNELHA